MESLKKYENYLPAWLHKSGLFFVVITDMEGKYIYVNDFFSKKFNSYDDIQERKYFTETVVQEDIQKAIDAATSCIMNPNKSYIVDLKKPFGKDTIHSQWAFSLLSNRQKTPLGIFAVGFEKILDENNSGHSFESFKNPFKIFEFVSDGFILLDKNRKIVSYNRSAERFINLNSDSSCDDLVNLLSESNLEGGFLDASLAALKTQKISNFKAYNKELDLFYIGITIPFDEGAFMIFRENTKDQKSRIRLQASENKLKAILDCTPDCIVLIDKNFKVLALNKVAIEFCVNAHQKTMDEGDDFRSFIFPETSKEFNKNFKKALEGGISKFEKEVSLSDNQKVWLEFTLYPVYDTKDEMIGVSQLVKDISEYKKNQGDLELQYNKLQQIAWVHSHEVRRPLANLMGLVQVLLAERDCLEEEQVNEFFEAILIESERLDEKIREITRATEQSNEN
jgi:PAS domain S-box-containing protein